VVIHNNDGFEIRKPKIKNCATINIGCNVKKQHSQSQRRAVPIYHLSHSGMRSIKLLRLGDSRNNGLIHKLFWA